MMIGIGIDHCKISRIEHILQRFEKGFTQRFFPSENKHCTKSPLRKIARYAMIFAAKESVAKALGTGFRQGVSMKTIEIIYLDTGQPTVKLHGKAYQHLLRLTPGGKTACICLSLSDESDLAAAFCTISAT